MSRIFHQVIEEEMPDFRYVLHYIVDIEVQDGDIIIMSFSIYSIELTAIDDQCGYEVDTERRGEYFTHAITTLIDSWTYQHQPRGDWIGKNGYFYSHKYIKKLSIQWYILPQKHWNYTSFGTFLSTYISEHLRLRTFLTKTISFMWHRTSLSHLPKTAFFSFKFKSQIPYGMLIKKRLYSYVKNTWIVN